MPVIERDKVRGRIAPEARQRSMLAMPEIFELGTLIEEDYVKKRLHDDQFAEYAAEKLGFAVSEANVKAVRTARKIPSTRETRRHERNLLEEERRRRKQDHGVDIDAVHQHGATEDSSTSELLATVLDLVRQWESFRNDAREKAASTSHRIDQFEIRVGAAERRIEGASRDAGLARDEVAAIRRDVEGMKTSAGQNFEKIGQRLAFLTKAQGSLLTKEHPNGGKPNGQATKEGA